MKKSHTRLIREHNITAAYPLSLYNKMIDHALSTNEIYELISRNKKALKVFHGVFSADQIPKLPLGKCIIVNCCTADRLGIHWVSLYRKSNKIIELFDSTGNKPRFYQDIVWPKCEIIQYNVNRIQAKNTSSCGFFCMIYCYYKEQNLNLKNIISKFKLSNLIKNDIKVFKLSKILFKI